MTNSYKVINAALKSTQNIVDQVSWKIFFTQFFSCHLFIAHCGSTSSVSVEKLVKHILDKFFTLQFVINSLLVNCVLLIVRTNFFSQNFFYFVVFWKCLNFLLRFAFFNTIYTDKNQGHSNEEKHNHFWFVRFQKVFFTFQIVNTFQHFVKKRMKSKPLRIHNKERKIDCFSIKCFNFREKAWVFIVT